MNEGLLSKRYAKALLDYADSVGMADELYPRMKALAREIMAIPDIERILSSPIIAKADKRKVIMDLMPDAPEILARFVDLVLNKEREEYLAKMALVYADLYRRSRNISVIRLISAKPLGAEAVGRICRTVESQTGGTTEVEQTTDESIGGGFIFQVDDRRLDASVRGQFERIKRELLQKTDKL